MFFVFNKYNVLMQFITLNLSFTLMRQKIFFFLLVGLLLSACSKEEYENPYESNLEQKDSKLILKFVMPFVMNRVHSGDMANTWLKFRLISQNNSDLMTVRTKFLPNGNDKTNVEIEFPEGKRSLNGRYVLCVTPLYKAEASAYTRASESEEGEDEASRYVIEVSDNTVTSVTKANNMTGFQYGDGSEENPYQIANADDFYMLLYNLYKDTTDAAGVYFQQTGDISWTDVEEKSISTGMNKIESFAGIYDGNGYSINDMSYHGANSTTYSNVGLFTELKNGAEVRNLNLGNISFTNVYKNCGAIAGSSSGSVTIDNISISGTMSFDNIGENIGGILGYANKGVQKITSITNNLSINGANTKVGGVVGYVENSTLECSQFTVNTTQFSIKGYSHVGTIAGKIYNSGFKISDININHIIPEEDRKVFIICATGHSVGGVIGCVEQCNESSLSDVLVRTSVGNTGTGTCTENETPDGSYVGGLIGYCNTSNKIDISNTKVSGYIKGYEYVGGFIGGLIGTDTYSPIVTFSGTNTIQPEESSYVAVFGEKAVGGVIGRMSKTMLTINNSVIINSNVYCQEIGAGLCGRMENVVCHLNKLQFNDNMSINGNDKIGGIVGYASGSEIYATTEINFTNGHQSALPEFKDFTLSFNGKIDGNDCVGGVAGYAEYSKISGLAVNADITASSNVGGIVGYSLVYKAEDEISSNAFSGNIVCEGSNAGGVVGKLEAYSESGEFNYSGLNNNITYGSVNGEESTGGVVGYLQPNSSTLTVQYCVNTASLIGIGDVGGIVAYVNRDGNGPTIQYCANFGDISASVSADDYAVGGIAAFAKLKGTHIYYCTNHGDITASGQYKGIGGIGGEVGHNTGTVSCSNNAYVKYCANFGNLQGDHSDSYVGGIVGFMQEGSASKGNCCIYDSYNRGEILSNHSEETGGILGHADYYNTLYRNINFGKVHHGNAIIGCRKKNIAILYLDDNYYLEGSGGDWKATDSFSEGEIGSSATYKGFDFDSVWEMAEGYPYLRNNPFQRTKF